MTSNQKPGRYSKRWDLTNEKKREGTRRKGTQKSIIRNGPKIQGGRMEEKMEWEDQMSLSPKKKEKKSRRKRLLPGKDSI